MSVRTRIASAGMLVAWLAAGLGGPDPAHAEPLGRSLLVVVESPPGGVPTSAEQVRRAIQAALSGRVEVVALEHAAPPAGLEARISWALRQCATRGAFAVALVRLAAGGAWILVVHAPARRALVRLLEQKAAGRALVEAVAVFVSDALEALAQGGGIEIVRPARSSQPPPRPSRPPRAQSRRPRMALEGQGGLSLLYEASDPHQVLPAGHLGLGIWLWNRALVGLEFRLRPVQWVEDPLLAVAVSHYPIRLRVAWQLASGAWRLRPGLTATVRLEHVRALSANPSLRVQPASWHVSLGAGASVEGCRFLEARLGVCAGAEGGWLFYRPTYGVRGPSGFQPVVEQGSWYLLARLSFLLTFWP